MRTLVAKGVPGFVKVSLYQLVRRVGKLDHMRQSAISQHHAFRTLKINRVSDVSTQSQQICVVLINSGGVCAELPQRVQQIQRGRQHLATPEQVWEPVSVSEESSNGSRLYIDIKAKK